MNRESRTEENFVLHFIRCYINRALCTSTSDETTRKTSSVCGCRVNTSSTHWAEREGGSEGGRGCRREVCVQTGTSHWKCLLCELVSLLDRPEPRTQLTSLLVSLLSAKLKVRGLTLHINSGLHFTLCPVTQADNV